MTTSTRRTDASTVYTMHQLCCPHFSTHSQSAVELDSKLFRVVESKEISVAVAINKLEDDVDDDDDDGDDDGDDDDDG